MFIRPKDALKRIQKRELTTLVVNGRGQIVAATGHAQPPSVDEILQLKHRYPDCALSVLERQRLTLQELSEEVSRLVKVAKVTGAQKWRASDTAVLRANRLRWLQEESEFTPF